MSNFLGSAFQNILSLGGKALPVTAALEQFSKLNPKMKSFISGATAAGWGADKIFSFLRDKFSGQESPDNRTSLRPDEKAAKSQRRQEEAPGKAIQTGATLAAAGLGGGLAARAVGAAIPAVIGGSESAKQKQQPSPEAQAQQAEQPKQPNLREQIIKQAEGMVPGSPAQQPSAPQAPQAPTGAATPIQSFIAQHPQLGAFLDQQIKNGALPEEAALAAKTNKKFQNDVAAIEQQVGQDFVSLVKQLFSFDQATEKVEVGDDVILGELAKLMKM